MMERMMNEIIKRFGFEAEVTIQFCTFCEAFEKGLMIKERVIEEYENILKRGMVIDFND